MIDAPEEVTSELTPEEQASVLLEVMAVSLAEALAQGVVFDLAMTESLSIAASGEGDIKLSIKSMDGSTAEVLVPAASVQEALGEVGSEESPEQESAEGEPASA